MFERLQETNRPVTIRTTTPGGPTLAMQERLVRELFRPDPPTGLMAHCLDAPGNDCTTASESSELGRVYSIRDLPYC